MIKPGEFERTNITEMVSGSQSGLTLASWACRAAEWTADNALKPAFNTGIIQPLNTLADGVNLVSQVVSGQKVAGHIDACSVPEAEEWTAKWAVQHISSGLDMALPFVRQGLADCLHEGNIDSAKKIVDLNFPSADEVCNGVRQGLDECISVGLIDSARGILDLKLLSQEVANRYLQQLEQASSSSTKLSELELRVNHAISKRLIAGESIPGLGQFLQSEP